MSKKFVQTEALKKTIADLDKQFGAGTVMLMDAKQPRKNIETISTGSIGIDCITGIGGLPRGRIIEAFGPESSGKTTLALHAVAQAHKLGQICAFIDAEHSLDLKYAEALGVDCSGLLLSQPDCGESALETVEALVRSGSVGLIVIDSVAALTPRSEIEGEMGDSQMGKHARLMSQALRKLTAITGKTNTCVIFINQLRSKIGVVFGCFHYDTLVNFVDGRSIPIGEVVDNKIAGSVYCLNTETNTVDVSEIIDWHDNGKVSSADQFVHIQTESIDGRGRFGFTCTKNHLVKTSDSWVQADKLTVNDRLVSKYTKTVNGTYGNFINGCLVGDSHISAYNTNTGCLKIQDNSNLAYARWKVGKLSKIMNFREIALPNDRYCYISEYTYEWSKLKKTIGIRDPMYFFNNYSALGLAIWFMDDASLDLTRAHVRYKLSIGRLHHQKDKLNQICQEFAKLGINCQFRENRGTIIFDKQNSLKIAGLICKYVPDCMQYKLPVEFRGKFVDFDLSNSSELVTETVPIVLIRSASKRQMRNKRKFDISVEGNHNYMVGGYRNGVVVHNSPEVCTGGNALKFYASMRFDIRNIGTLKIGENKFGSRTRIKLVKNKLAPPFKQYECDILYGKGIDPVSELIDLGVETNVIEKAGAWYSYNGARLAQGKDNARINLEADKAMCAEINKKVRAIKLG